MVHAEAAEKRKGMEPEQEIANVNKPSGLARPSRLPTLKNKPSQVSLQDAVEPQKTINGITKVQKPPSIPSFSRPGQPASKLSSATGKPLTSRSDLPNGSKHLPRSSTSTANSPRSIVRSSVRANQQRLPPLSANTTSNPEDQENHDGLSSLDSFRAASRQGFYDDLPAEPQVPVDTTDLTESSKKTKESRPSLSDRTIESIQRLPSTPKQRRRSSFFSPVESPMGPPPRPSSSLSRDGSNGRSRPVTSDGNYGMHLRQPSSLAKKVLASAKAVTKTSVSSIESSPVNPHRRAVSSAFATRVQGNKKAIPQSPKSTLASTPAASSAMSNGQRNPRITSASKTIAAKPKPRPSLSDAFDPAVREATTQSNPALERKLSSRPPAPNDSTHAVANISKASSKTLRQQIAAAKAAARIEKAKHDSPQRVSMADESAFEIDTFADPFGQAPKDEKHILRNRINAARMDGKLNIAAFRLKDIPDEVLTMYDATAMEETKVNWAEVVDLTRLIAADNEIEDLSGAVFPDKSAEDFAMDDQTEGNQFGGLEMLDLHGNRLRALPMGLRRLERLSSLNLAHNKLENSGLDVISQITSLKDLRLGCNALSGSLPASICNMRRLETLDLQSNRLLGLPDALRELVGLKVLNVSSNQLTTVPMEALQDLPLTELDASSNALIASLFPVGGKNGHPTLQTLKVANNSLAALTFDESLDLPHLRSLDVTSNHLTSIPAVSAFPELITLMAGDNKIGELPLGFTSLRKLRNVNFSSNELRLLDPEIANMESLESLILASNPLREKKFLTMSAADIKRDLKAKLAPVEVVDVESLDRDTLPDACDTLSSTLSSPSSLWVLKANGTLELAGKGYSDGINDSLGSFLRNNEVNQLHLQSNVLTAVPPALWLGQDLRVLDLAGNALSSDYLSDELELPALQDLNLSRCRLHALEQLITHLRAPNLQTLDVTANRLSGALPMLRRSYSALTTLLASDNRFTAITADSLHGFHVVNLSSNNIEQLPAEVGLLWDEGLRSLEIGGNAFRVPNYRTLEKGTEATLRWLRDKLPASHSMPVVNPGPNLTEGC